MGKKNHIRSAEQQLNEEKLAQLKKPWWKKPEYLTIIIPAMITLIGITADHYYSENAHPHSKTQESSDSTADQNHSESKNEQKWDNPIEENGTYQNDHSSNGSSADEELPNVIFAMGTVENAEGVLLKGISLWSTVNGRKYETTTDNLGRFELKSHSIVHDKIVNVWFSYDGVNYLEEFEPAELDDLVTLD